MEMMLSALAGAAFTVSVMNDRSGEFTFLSGVVGTLAVVVAIAIQLQK